MKRKKEKIEPIEKQLELNKQNLELSKRQTTKNQLKPIIFSFIQRWESKFTNHKDTINTFLTLMLILVTIFSIIATIQITKVSLALENQRQRELIISKIDYVEKLILETSLNNQILKDNSLSLNELKTNEGYFLQDKISITRIENADDFIDNNSIIMELDTHLTILKLIKGNLDNIKQNSINNDNKGKNITIDIALQNINVLLNGVKNDNNELKSLQSLIDELEIYRIKLEKDLMDLRKI